MVNEYGGQPHSITTGIMPDGPIRVLHCVSAMNRGGAETLVMNLYRNIDRSRVQFDFVTSGAGAFDREIDALGGRIFRVPYTSGRSPLRYGRALLRVFRGHPECRIVHAHIDKTNGIVLHAARQAAMPHRIAHVHNIHSSGGVVTRCVKAGLGLVMNHDATVRMACSHAAAEWGFGSESHSTIIVPNAINLESFSYSERGRDESRRLLNISGGPVIGHVGRFCKQKNQEFLVDVFAEVLTRESQAELLLVGSGPTMESVARRARDLGIERRVHLVGDCSNVAVTLQAMDVFAFPSLYEGLGIVLLEAQAAGLHAVVSSSVPRDADVVGNLQYLPLSVGTKGWASAILEASNYERRDGESERSALRKREYDISQIVIKMTDFYIKLVA